MTTVSTRIALAAGAGLIALGISAGVMASAQNTSQDPGSFSQPPGGRHVSKDDPERVRPKNVPVYIAVA